MYIETMPVSTNYGIRVSHDAEIGVQVQALENCNTQTTQFSQLCMIEEYH
jgi:hypothetical protein